MINSLEYAATSTTASMQAFKLSTRSSPIHKYTPVGAF